jgi:PAS domain S-box-containing protein
MFSKMSIRHKLVFILWGFALVAYAVAGVGLAVFHNLTLERRARQAMEPYARFVLVGTDAAVAFEDPIRAKEILDALQANPQIMDAAIVLGDGRLLAGFGTQPDAARLNKPDGIHLLGDMAELLQPLAHGARLRLTMKFAPLGKETRQVLWLFGAGALVLLAITLGQLTVLQQTIITRITTLAAAAESVRTRADYDQHVPAAGDDEVALLGRSFNAMMETLRVRDRDLRQLARFLCTLVDSAAHAIVSIDSDGMVTSFNAAAERLLGYGAKEIVGRRSPILWHDPEEVAQRARQLSEELGEPITAGFEVFTARACRGLPDENEWTFIRKDGTRVPVLLSVSALRDEDDKLAGFVGLVNDLTERRQAEEELAKYREHLEELVRERTAELEVARNKAQQYLDIAGVILVAIDAGRRVALINQKGCEVLQRNPSEIIGKDWFETFVPEKIRQDGIYGFDQLMAGKIEPVEYFENPVLTQDGEELLIAWHNVLLRDESGKIIGTLGSGEDITAQRHSEVQIKKLNWDLKARAAALQAANKELEAFAYSVSHDLRAPLRHIDGFLELLQKKAGTALDEQGRHYMETIAEAAQKMGLLIDDLLAFSRMGRHALAVQSVDLGNLVRDVIRELEPDAAGRTIDWRIGELPAVSGDGAMLRMVLTNLIANALKFTLPRQQAQIEIGSLPGQDAEAVIFVRDNGVGFDMTYVDRLFGVFQRLHRADQFEGTGIGLANVRRIITRHGGKTWAEGKPDQGATFFFSLPLENKE